jgi:hypothetical protein
MEITAKGGAESMPYLSRRFVHNPGHGHIYEK